MNIHCGDITESCVDLFDNHSNYKPKFIFGHISIPTMYSYLGNVKFFNSVEYVFGNINLFDVDVDIVDFTNLKFIRGSLCLNYTNFETLEMFSNLRYIGGDLDIRYCDCLKNLKGLENLRSVKNINIQRDDNFEDIFEFCTNLDSLDGLDFGAVKCDILGNSDSIKNYKIKNICRILDGIYE